MEKITSLNPLLRSFLTHRCSLRFDKRNRDGGKKTMRIKIKDSNGKVIQEIEVDDEFGEWYVEQERLEENAERRDRYWVKVRLGQIEYEGSWIQDKSPTPDKQCEISEEEKRINEFKKTLTPTQLRRLEMLEEGLSERDISDIEKTCQQSIHETIVQLRAKFINFFGYDPCHMD